MMCGELVGTVCLAIAPVNLKMALTYAVTDPIESHVNGFGPFLLDSVGYNATGSIVISQ
jgi:hypothetical protein